MAQNSKDAQKRTSRAERRAAEAAAMKARAEQMEKERKQQTIIGGIVVAVLVILVAIGAFTVYHNMHKKAETKASTETVQEILALYEKGLHNLTRTRFIPNEPIRYLGNSTQDGVVSDHQAHEYDNAWAEWVTLLAWLTANDDDDTLIETTTRQLNELGVGTTTQILRNRADKTEPDNRFYSHAAEDGTI